MENQETELTPEEAKASLGLSTRLSEGFLMSQSESNTSSEPLEETQASDERPEQTEPSQAPSPELDVEALKAELKEDLKKELVDEVRKEVMNELKDALDDDK